MKIITERKMRFIYLLFLLFIFIFIFGSSVREYYRLGFREHKFEVLKTGWQRILPDGSKKKLGSSEEMVLIKDLLIERQLPSEVPYSLTTLYIKTMHQDLTIWIDEKPVYQFDYQDIPPFNSKIPPLYWVRIPIQKDQLGSTIRIEFRGRARSVENTLEGLYFGEDLSIICEILWKNILQIFSSLCLIFMGIGLLVEYLILDRRRGEEKGSFYLGAVLFFLGLWMGCQIDARQLIFNNILLIWNMEYLSLIMIPIPALLFINKVERGNCQRGIYWLCLLIALCDLLIIISAGVGLYSFAELNLLIDCILLLTCFAIARSFVVIRWRDPDLFKDLTWMIGAGSTLISFSCIELVSYFLNGYENQGRFLSVGSVIFAFQMIHMQSMEYDKVRNEKNKLEVAEKVQSEFLANMSHEIRTPINTVIGMNEMILRESHDDVVLGYARNIQVSGESLLSLVNDILDFSRIESSGIKLVPKPYELANLLHELSNTARFRAEWKNLRFSVIVDEDTPAVLFGDVFRIREVLVNLLDNAIKYTDTGTVTLTVTFKSLPVEEKKFSFNEEDANVSPEDREEQPPANAVPVELQFAVKDTGLGISEKDQKLVFQKFQRVHSGWRKNIQGTGLGLPITRYLTKLMHGRIELKSALGEGSCFTAYIPQYRLNDESIGNFEDRYKKQKGVGNGFNKGFIASDAKILVVDDNELNLQLVKNLLKRTEVQIDVAYSGEECLEKLATGTYDIVYLDHMMAGMNGEETLEKIREQAIENRYGKPIPVIAFSSNVYLFESHKDGSSKFDAYLLKPVDGNELDKSLYTFLPENLIRKRSNEEYFEAEMKKHTISEKEDKEKLLDREIGLAYCMQDESVYQEILTLFKENSTEKQKELEDAFSSSDYAKYRLYSHGLKTTSLTVGAVLLSENAKKMEYAAKRVVEGVEKEEAIQYIRYNHSAFIRLYNKTVEEASKYLEP